MYICICQAITDKQIKSAITEGATSIAALRHELGIGNPCGRCCQAAKNMLKKQCSATHTTPHITTHMLVKS